MKSDTTLDDIYEFLKKNYQGKLYGDNFIKPNIRYLDYNDQIICWFNDVPEDIGEEEYDDYCTSTLNFFNDVSENLIDEFGDTFFIEDPRVSDKISQSSNRKGKFYIGYDDNDLNDGQLPNIYIWPNNE